MDKNTSQVFKHFKLWTEDKLEIKKPAKTLLHLKREELKTYADYNPNEGVVRVCVHNRSVADCLRSMAHELVHHKQNEQGRIKNSGYDVELEDEANAIAGRLIRQYANEHPEKNVYDTFIND